MANHVNSTVTVHGNEEAVKHIDSLMEKANDGEITTLAKTFFENVELGESGGVMNTWSNDNMGSKWTYLEDIMDDGEYRLVSAWYPPAKFFIHLYKMVNEIDPEGYVEVIYEDEGYDPIGAVVIKKDKDGTPCIWAEEDNEIEDPTVDKDWDDEDYDDVQMEFMESLYDREQEMLQECHDLIDTDGEPIDEYQD